MLSQGLQHTVDKQKTLLNTRNAYELLEEKRIFMFLDLHSSTFIAEKLGHKLYSEFIQDCFLDLEVVRQHKAEIYQYVGDEVILTWNFYDGVEENNCIESFFTYKKRLETMSEYYNSKYGFMPEFKAGMNAGMIIKTNVGILKKELAYHGDTINVAARIQKKANMFNAELLISDTLKKLLRPANRYLFKNHGDLILKGKSQRTKILSVSKNILEIHLAA